MSNAYIYQNEKLKNSFKNIISMKREIGTTKNKVANKLAELKKLHSEMIKDNNKQIFLFCLDSFYYQYKIFAMEFDHIKKLRAILNNRMYCDYYKLHNIIIKFCKDYITDDSLNIHTFPVYKDLEPFQEYRIEDIVLLHESILNLINTLYIETKTKKDAILHYNDNHKVGFSISNFLNTLTHENKILQEQISLFVNYISFFHISQQKQLKKLHHRVSDFYSEVDDNINMNYTFSIDDIGDEQTMDMLSETTGLEDEDRNMEIPESILDMKVMDAPETGILTTTPEPFNLETHVIEPIFDNNIMVAGNISTIPKFSSLSLTIPK
jgi:hypothetical protein